jgi:hypothetical protein
VLEEIKRAVSQLAVSPTEGKDAVLDVEQLRTELQRWKPDKKLIWTLVEHLNGLSGSSRKGIKVDAAFAASWPLGIVSFGECLANQSFVAAKPNR